MCVRILFHHPRPLRPDATSGSSIRPARMLQAFRDLGFDVDVVAGRVNARREAMRAVYGQLAGGARYAFMYAENSTIPSALTEPHHLPVAPGLDAAFFTRVHDRGIPIGLFYRDIYWKFDSYDAQLPWPLPDVGRFFFRRELRWYSRTVTRLYLPSLAMGQYLPTWPGCEQSALPPGFDPLTASSLPSVRKGCLRLLYVGGVSWHYEMHALFEAVARLPAVHLTVCTRANEWEAAKAGYARWLGANVDVVHRAGKELDALFDNADVALLYIRPDTYRSFAAPLKLYEYLGRQRPLIASDGTLAADFVGTNAVGWTLPYAADALVALLRRLLERPEEVMERARTCAQVAPFHTWQARARQVVGDLVSG